jgi:hypothetical protein
LSGVDPDSSIYPMSTFENIKGNQKELEQKFQELDKKLRVEELAKKKKR